MFLVGDVRYVFVYVVINYSKINDKSGTVSRTSFFLNAICNLLNIQMYYI